jgi:nucleoside 2-deoxyribosyltransferase
MIYLASPYSHNSAMIRQQRYHLTCRAASKLMKAGIVVFSPLANTIPAIEIGGLELKHPEFMALDIPLLMRCDELLVIALDGWEQSVGVTQEIFAAKLLQKPITWIDEKDIERLPAIPKSAKRFLQSEILTEVYDDN